MTNLTRAVDQERTLSLLPRELQGSQTAQRQAAQADANAGSDLGVPFNPGSPLGWIGMAGRGVLNRVSTTRNAKVNEALLPKMLETNPQAIEALIVDLERKGQSAQAAKLRRELRGLYSAGVGSPFIGGAVAVPGGE
jgi:hypothetical protein